MDDRWMKRAKGSTEKQDGGKRGEARDGAKKSRGTLNQVFRFS